MEGIQNIKLQKGMSKDQVNNIIKKWIKLKDEVFLGVRHSHNWECLCGKPIEGRRFDTIKGDKKKPPRLTCDKCTLKRKRQQLRKKYKEMVENVEGYVYIRSYFENDIVLIGKPRLIKNRNNCVQVKHIPCNHEYVVQSSSFNYGDRCSNCPLEYEKSFEYYMKNTLGGDINDYWCYEKNQGIKPSEIPPKGSTNKYYFNCNLDSTHKAYKITTGEFISCYNNTKGCPACVQEYKKNNGKRLGELNIKHTEASIVEKIEKSNINRHLQLEHIDRPTQQIKKTIIFLKCEKHNDSLQRISSTEFDKKINNELICDECILEEKQNEAYNEFIQNEFYPEEDEIKKWKTRKSRIICKTKDGYSVKVNLEKLKYRVFIKSEPDLSLNNLKILGEKVNLKLESPEYIDANTRYTFIKDEEGKKYKIQTTIGELNKALKRIENNESIDSLFNKFGCNNDYRIENLDIYLATYNLKRLSKDIQYKEKLPYVNAIENHTKYKYKIYINDLVHRKKIPNAFDTRNEDFFKENIQELCNKRKLNLKIDLEQKIESRLKIRATNEDGMTVIISSDELQRDRDYKPKMLHNSYPNEVNINNIKLWCKKNRPDYRLISKKYKNAKEDLEWEYIGDDIIIRTKDDRKFKMAWHNFKRYKEPQLFVLRKTERIVRDTLLKYNMNVEVQVKLSGCKNKNELPFDFVVFKPNKCKDIKVSENQFKDILFVLEYNGPHHIKPIYGTTQEEKEINLKKTKENDRIKESFCKYKNINFEVLHQTKYKDIPNEVERILKKYR